jgi:hypothetical protein
MGPTTLLPLLRKACCGYYSPLQMHRLRPFLNVRTLVPMASTLTIRPPRTTRSTQGIIYFRYCIFINATDVCAWFLAYFPKMKADLSNQPVCVCVCLCVSVCPPLIILELISGVSLHLACR